jgi:hypothetical protein
MHVVLKVERRIHSSSCRNRRCSVHYSLCKYGNASDDKVVTFFAKTPGPPVVIKQRPDAHLRGQGCPMRCCDMVHSLVAIE